MIARKRSGLGICDVLAIVFIVLKLLGIINWSWWVAPSLILIPITIVLVLYGIIAICDG